MADASHAEKCLIGRGGGRRLKCGFDSSTGARPAGQGRFGPQTRGTRRGVEQQRIRPPPPAPRQRGGLRRMQRGGAADTALDDVGNLAFDTVLAGRLVDHHMLFRLHKLRLRHGIGALYEAGHTRQQAALGLLFRCPVFFSLIALHRGHPQFGQGSRIGGLLLRGEPRLFAALCLSLLNALRHLNRAGSPSARHVHRRSIGHDRADHQEAHDAHQFGPGEPQHKGTECDDGHRHHQRHQLDREGRPDGQHRQDRPHHGIAEQSPQPEAVGIEPFRIRGERCRIDRPQCNGDGRKDQAAHGALFTPVQGKAPAPEQQDGSNPPGSPPHDHEQRRGERGTHAPHPVLHGGVGADHPVGIVGRVAADHHRRHDPQRDKPEAEQFLAPLLDGLGHVAVHQRIPPACLICHCSLPSSHVEYRQSRIASNPRVVSSFGATSATLMYALPGFCPFTSAAR